MNKQLRNAEAELAASLQLELQPRRFWSVRKLVIAAVVVVLTTVTALYFWKPAAGAGYLTTAVTTGPLTVTVSATGTLQPQDQVDVGAEISGRVDQVNVDYNDRVKKGQVLAVINTDQIRAQLDQAVASQNAARADVAAGEATVTDTLKKRDRARALFQIGGIAQQEVQTAEADYERAVANVAKAKATVENTGAQTALYRTQLDRALVRSPIDGVVLDRKVSTGQTVAAAFQTPVLFTLASDLKTLQLQVDIDEADIGLVREGQPATFTVDAYPQREFQAKLISLHNAPKTTNGVVTYQGVLAVDNSSMLLRPGLTANVNILVSRSDNAMLVPNGALRFMPRAKDIAALPPVRAVNGEMSGRVWVLENGKPAARDVKIGRTDGHSTEVLSGALRPGDWVITDIGAGSSRT